MTPATLNPYDIPPALDATTLEALEADPLCTLAREVAEDVQRLHTFSQERPRFAALFDQAQRSSSSIFLNTFQGYAKLRGYLQNDLLCARAEAYETWAALALFPKDVSDPIRAKLRGLVTMLNERIRNIPDKPAR